MNNLLSTSALVTVLGLLVIAGANVAFADQKRTVGNAYECFTDDGNGRLRPCSAGHMQKRADSNAYDCFTDDGYGRKLPCTFRVKR